ncbi:MAG: class I SAM-dependent methyltransferase [Gemmataceae bacterium]|nr:class I SAM-dependent methyltransferase [Gemmataceae bacterium]MCI0738640.1 class I SAM-dependent methyltransferase [Gemmataceae bacterium]
MQAQPHDQSPQSPSHGAHHRFFVGPPEQFDRSAALQFTLLTCLGLREYHTLLDIGCGALRAGRLFIPYLLAGNYYGIEPQEWLVEAGVQDEVGSDLVRIKRPTFRYADDFSLSAFGRQFDYLIAQSIFSHAAAEQIRQCLAEAKKVMLPTSVFAATFRQGSTNYTGRDWVYPGCSTYRLEYFTRLVEDAGLSCRVLTWPQPNQQTWTAIGNEQTLARLPRSLCDPELAKPVHELFGDSAGLPWAERLAIARDELAAALPPGATVIVADEDQWGLGKDLSGRRLLPFTEHDGQYWGPPADDAAAVREVERLRQAGAGFMVFGWPTFWWLRYYVELHRYLRTRYRCVIENDRVIVFDLQD